MLCVSLPDERILTIPATPCQEVRILSFLFVHSALYITLVYVVVVVVWLTLSPFAVLILVFALRFHSLHSQYIKLQRMTETETKMEVHAFKNICTYVHLHYIHMHFTKHPVELSSL